MKPMRDNFLQKTIETLKTRVAHRCSNPNCRIVTAGPTIDIGKANIIGEAAHLSAAAPGGPRYDAAMLPNQRKSIENAIWLCSNCSDLIDKDPNAYPIELLKEWKQTAEKLALEELGKKLPDKFDAIDTLTTALTGTCNKFIPEMLKNVSIASTNCLQKLDPRFRVNVEYAKQATQYTFSSNSNEPVDLRVQIVHNRNIDFNAFFTEMKDYGKPINIPIENFKLTGSPIFDKLIAENDFQTGILSLKPQSIKASTKIWLSKENETLFMIDDFHGEIFQGEQAFSFEGYSCGELLHFSFRKDNKKQSEQSSYSLAIDFVKWTGLDIAFLPYFNKLYDFIERIKDDWVINGVLEINGEKILEAHQNKFGNKEAIDELYIPLKYILMIKKLSQYLGISFIFEETYITKEKFNILEQFYMAVTHLKIKPPFHSNPTAVVNIENIDNFKNISLNKLPISIFIEQITGEFNLFGQNITLPILKHVFTSVYPKFEYNISSLNIGDEVKLEFIPAETCEYYIDIIE